MKRLIALLLLIPSLALAQSVAPRPSFLLRLQISQASGADGIQFLTNGARLHLGTGANDYFYSDGASVLTPATLLAASFVARSGSGLVSGNISDGSTAVGVKIGNTVALANATARLAQFCDDANTACAATHDKMAVDATGAVRFPQKCDSSGTPGNATCNQAAGQAAFAAAGNAVTITDSLVTATSVVLPVLQATDTTCTAVKSVVPAAGSFTINTNATCTATTKIGWVVFQ